MIPLLNLNPTIINEIEKLDVKQNLKINWGKIINPFIILFLIYAHGFITFSRFSRLIFSRVCEKPQTVKLHYN